MLQGVPRASGRGRDNARDVARERVVSTRERIELLLRELERLHDPLNACESSMLAGFDLCRGDVLATLETSGGEWTHWPSKSPARSFQGPVARWLRAHAGIVAPGSSLRCPRPRGPHIRPTPQRLARSGPACSVFQVTSPRMKRSTRSGASKETTATIVSWNIENLARHVVEGAAEPLAAIATRLGSPEILCLQEIRVRPQDTELIGRMRAALPGYACHFALCQDAKNVTFRGGRMYGVATYVHERLGDAVPSTCDWDREGRVVVTELAGRGLAIVNVYAVNGTSKPYWDHELGRFDGDRHGFKRRFNERLMRACEVLLERGLELVMIGDWNISRTKLDTFPRLRMEEPHALARAMFNETFLPTLGAVDIFRHLHPEARKYTWFNPQTPPGKLDAARVDFALVTEDLVPRVVETDILDAPEDRFRSDHAPLFLRLRL
ncbi:endonuclease/exonuclease/phosphatase family protein [Nannocystis pusilla]|uniref:endonuclease/exonuclease/phosphatase family protein n=1 Tax=Nannocystis pusilla TaxID=889268 RepID=UPI003B7D01D1